MYASPETCYSNNKPGHSFETDLTLNEPSTEAVSYMRGSAALFFKSST